MTASTNLNNCEGQLPMEQRMRSAYKEKEQQVGF